MLALDKGSVVVVGSVVMGLTEATVLFAFLTLCSSLILEKEPTLKLRTSGLVGSNAFGRSVLAAGDGRTRARISRYKRASQSCGLGNNTLLEISPVRTWSTLLAFHYRVISMLLVCSMT